MSGLRRLRKKALGLVTVEFLSGVPTPDLTDAVDPVDSDVDIEAIERLFEKAVSLGYEGSELDQWLAPRLHFLMRIPRRIASDKWMWTWMAMTIGRKYVLERWAENGKVTRFRYHGDLLRNAISRLWWGAEMTRNGPNYALVPVVFKRVRTAQFALELKYSWYRPAAIAFTRVAEAVGGGKVLSDQAMNDLSKSVNAYLSLTALEAIAGEEYEDTWDTTWRELKPTLADAIDRDVQQLEGPADGYSSEAAVAAVESWMRSIEEKTGTTGKAAA